MVDATSPPARRRRPPFLAVLGIAVVAAVLGATSLILLSFGGAFTNYSAVTAQVPLSSTAVAIDSPVEYRNVAVGKVTSTGVPGTGGMISLDIHLKPSVIANIPANVTATVAPVSIFGNEYVVLVPPANPSSTPLRAGATIPALQTDTTASLQSTLGDLDHLLIQLDPGQLDAALTAIASSLQGQGSRLGQTLVAAHSYLGAMQPLWPTVIKDLQTLVPVAGTLAQASPDIVGILRNVQTPSQTVSGAGTQVNQLLGNGATLVGQVSGLLDQVRQPFNLLAAESAPFFSDLSGAAYNDPQEIAQILAGLSTWASTWTAAESSGPYLNLTADISVVNPADLGLALLGGPLASADLAAGLGAGFVNPATYTSAAVPARGVLAASAPHVTAPAGPAMILGAQDQQAAVDEIVKGMTGRAPASPAASTLLVGSLLSGLVGGS